MKHNPPVMALFPFPAIVRLSFVGVTFRSQHKWILRQREPPQEASKKWFPGGLQGLAASHRRLKTQPVIMNPARIFVIMNPTLAGQRIPFEGDSSVVIRSFRMTNGLLVILNPPKAGEEFHSLVVLKNPMEIPRPDAHTHRERTNTHS